MANEHQSAASTSTGSSCAEYVPPKVERVLTPEQLEREVLYAGVPPSLPECDRNLKENFAPVEPSEVLEKLASLRVEQWNYKADAPSIRHIGPMAQDFAAAFGVGEDDRHIHPVDAFGVAFAAIQALIERVEHLEAANAAMRAHLAAVEERTPMTVRPEALPDREEPAPLPAAH
jgi:hypothetical protein